MSCDLPPTVRQLARQFEHVIMHLAATIPTEAKRTDFIASKTAKKKLTLIVKRYTNELLISAQ